MRTLAVIVALSALAVGSARAGQDATFILDRTYSCAIPLQGGIHQIENRAHPGARLNGAWTKLAYAGVRAGAFSGGAGNLLAWVSAGVPTKTTTVDQEYWSFEVRTLGTAGIRTDGCAPTTSAVPLSAGALRGGPAYPLGSELRCESPRRLLVRLRAVLSSRAALRGREVASVHVPVREAKLAVRTLSGAPLSYATVAESGKATLFTAKGCVAE
ncbi:MAG TPA: hypothetical protein VFU99_11465 [Gaiellaceae bacterium]|nr:hypothetical protein [Gaiellaceae bacterium]